MLPLLLGMLLVSPVGPRTEVVVLDNDQVRVVRVEGEAPGNSSPEKDGSKPAAIYVYLDGSGSVSPGTFGWRRLASQGHFLRIELKRSAGGQDVEENRPAPSKTGVSTEFESREMRVERVALNGKTQGQEISAGKPSLLIAFSPTSMQLHSKPRSFTTTLECGDFYWMRPFESAVLKRTAECDAHALRIVFLS